MGIASLRLSQRRISSSGGAGAGIVGLGVRAEAVGGEWYALGGMAGEKRRKRRMGME
jgi:hypothetical protein